MKALVVTNQFGEYKLSEHITDPEEIAEVLAGANAGSVVPINLPDASPTKQPKSE